jgi:hypothetical protein
MKEKFFTFCEKYFTGGYNIKVKKDLYVTFPKIATIFTIAFILVTLGEVKEVDLITYIGYILTGIGFFGFFYYNLFPNRIPKK